MVNGLKKCSKMLLCTASMAVILRMFSAFAATGEGVPDPDPSTRTDVTVNITSPDVYSGELEFYCEKETFYITIPSNETQTTATYNVPKGSYTIGFLDPNDISDSFDISYNNHLDTEKQSTIDVTIDYADSVKEYTGDDVEGDEGIVAEDIAPAEYDFSNGEEHGTLAITCTQYGSIDTVVYKIMGVDKVYEITLDAEHDFKANVYLPAGSYKELTSISVTPNELATVTNDITFAWGHRNSTYYGKNYEIATNNVVNVDDLYIKMNYQGDLREVDDFILMQTKIRNNYTELVDERRDEFIEENLPDTHPTIAEPETTAPEIAEAVAAKPGNEMWKTIAIAGVIIIGIAAIAIVAKIRKEAEE